jgi:sulfoquinovose isomerase
MTSSSSAAASTRWTALVYHRGWLLDQASALFAFFEPESINPAGGFFVVDDEGRPIQRSAASAKPPARELFVTTRHVHCFAIGKLLGRPGADDFIDHGMAYLWNAHRDTKHGGYFWGVGDDGPSDPLKQAYGHAFVLLAGSSAKCAGHPDADRLIADVTDVLREHFWESAHGAVAEEFKADWTPISQYRGQNSNMHLTEALMAAFEATGDNSYLEMAESVASLIIGRHARERGWRVAEHFNENWELDVEYSGGDVFRPAGTTPGHSLEWTRLCLQLWELGGRRLDWLHEAAKAIFARAAANGWDEERGGFHYTLDWDDKPLLRNRLWWPCAEGIGAAHFLNEIDGDAPYELWYRRIWDFVANNLIDRENGGWYTEVPGDPGVSPLFEGKPDLYHALQANLIPLLPTTGSVAHTLTAAGLK